eukprot:gb/GFBE01025507.1/.p1 GENE.gb/GFBE01025507.1/~~gb/GFBE01025507.1/.p1  ORF type:complete len:327 (+),score=41.15 gb/GFBE01025507.1/:1-981(+)
MSNAHPSASSNAWNQQAANGRHRKTNDKLKAVLQRTVLCKFFEAGTCKRGSACTFAHNSEELRIRPDLSKSRLCRVFRQHGMCPQGEACDFAHSRAERRTARERNAQLAPLVTERPASEAVADDSPVPAGLLQTASFDRPGDVRQITHGSLPAAELEEAVDCCSVSAQASSSVGEPDCCEVADASTRSESFLGAFPQHCLFSYATSSSNNPWRVKISWKNSFLHFEDVDEEVDECRDASGFKQGSSPASPAAAFEAAVDCHLDSVQSRSRVSEPVCNGVKNDSTGSDPSRGGFRQSSGPSHETSSSNNPWHVKISVKNSFLHFEDS